MKRKNNKEYINTEVNNHSKILLKVSKSIDITKKNQHVKAIHLT